MGKRTTFLFYITGKNSGSIKKGGVVTHLRPLMGKARESNFKRKTKGTKDETRKKTSMAKKDRRRRSGRFDRGNTEGWTGPDKGGSQKESQKEKGGRDLLNA